MSVHQFWVKRLRLKRILLLSCFMVAPLVCAKNAMTGVRAVVPLTLDSLVSPYPSSNLRSGSSVSYTLSGASSDYVNYIQLCNATDSSCSSCNAPFTVITVGTPIPYLSTGTSIYINSAAIAAYLSNHNFTAGNYNIGMYVQSEHFKCSSDLAYCSDNVDNATPAHRLCMQATYDGTTVTALARSDNGSAALTAITPQYAYVASTGGDGGQAVYKCSLNMNGTLNICGLTPSASPWGSPFSVAMITIHGAQYAYVADSAKGIYRCAFNDTNGLFYGCNLTPASGTLSGPQDVTVATATNNNQYAYVVSSNHIYQCSINSSDGSFVDNGCSPLTPTVGGEPNWLPRGITTANINGAEYAYVAAATSDGYTSGVFACTFNNDGTFNSCNLTPSSGAPSWNSQRIAIATVNGVQYAYVADVTAHRAYQCLIHNDGTLYNCNSMPPPPSSTSWALRGMALPFIFPNL